MFQVPLILLALCGGYLIGSVPWAFILVRLRTDRDIRKEGSGNVGTLNSYVVTGSKRVAAAVLLLDLAKGFCAAEFGWGIGAADFTSAGVALLGAILGHNYPVWLRFKGGRGLAPAAGGMLAIAWVVVPAWCILWGIAYFLLRSVNPASAAASIVVATLGLVLPDEAVRVASGGAATGLFRVFLLLVMLGVLAKLFGEVQEYIAERRRRRTAEIGR